MNCRYVEILYCVAGHGGISEAIRHVPLQWDDRTPPSVAGVLRPADPGD
jgi:hypothetical protein